MAMPFPNESESSVYIHILKKNPKKWNLNSLWAFLLSILVYVWVFYVFNLAPSSDLLCTTKFWFIISNTLILIIAADFSSSKNQPHNTFNFSHDKTMPSSPAPFLIHEKTMPIYSREKQEEEEVDGHQEPPEKIINVVHAQVLENKISKIHKGNAGIIKSKLERKEEMVEDGTEKQGKMVLRRTLSERQHEEPMVLEENEFTKMSNEELNRRVEEFIRRCNRQIRGDYYV